MYVIVGLGNPGKKYEQTRHNMGFITIDQLAESLGVKVQKIKFKALIGEGRIGTEKVVLVKPQTYMNLSGESVRPIMDYYKVDPDHLIVIYDDMDVALGQLRIRKKGSAGSHNGMKSVIGMLGSSDFPRIRVGIGDHKGMDAVNFVIGGFRKEEVEPLEKAVTRAVKAVTSIIEEGCDIAMNKYNGNVE